MEGVKDQGLESISLISSTQEETPLSSSSFSAPSAFSVWSFPPLMIVDPDFGGTISEDCFGCVVYHWVNLDMTFM